MRKETPSLVFTLTPKQRQVLRGTSVEDAYNDMQQAVTSIMETVSNFTAFKQHPLDKEEAVWSASVILKHGKVVHPTQDLRESVMPRMYLLPHLSLMGAPMNPDPEISIVFQEEMVREKGKEEDMVLLIARKDMAKNETVHMWPGQLSDSELVLRHNITFKNNPIGMGSNISLPSDWNEDPTQMKSYKEFKKFNCSEVENFQIRISRNGKPNQDFVRCYRLAWFINHGWYHPGYGRPNMIAMLNQWPPPTRYTHTEWLAWTQADNALSARLTAHCEYMKQQLKSSVSDEIKQYFRTSTDGNDKAIWRLRQVENTAWNKCIAQADN